MAQAVSVITEAPVENEVVQLSIFGEEEPRKNRKGSAHQVAVTEIHENPALKEFISSVRDADLMNHDAVAGDESVERAEDEG